MKKNTHRSVSSLKLCTATVDLPKTLSSLMTSSTLNTFKEKIGALLRLE
jgi:hypothetical protein